MIFLISFGICIPSLYQIRLELAETFYTLAISIAFLIPSKVTSRHLIFEDMISQVISEGLLRLSLKKFTHVMTC
jgi:hypothetical protein